MNLPSRILMIGAAGFVGRSLSRRLLAAGVAVEGIVRSPTSQVEPGVRVHTGGLEDGATLRTLVERCDAIVHVASASTPSASRVAPSIEALLNLAPTLRLLETLQDSPTKPLVYMSSGGAIYGSPALDAVPEDAPLAPQSYYAAGKASIEMFLQAYARAFAGVVTVLRPSNVYGPGQPHYVAFGVVRTMLQHALDGTPMEIWGDGRVVRDYIHIDDLVDAFVAVLSAPPSNRTYNVGAGVGHSLREVLAEVELAAGRPIEVHFRPARAIDVPRIVLDTRRIKAELGWSPKVTLPEGIADTWRWLAMARSRDAGSA
jgi:UDP-glucose 4-epimerase